MCDIPASYLVRLHAAFGLSEAEATARLAASLRRLRAQKAQVFVCGNGGSAANANHWANDLLYGAGKTGLGGLRAHSLVANTSVITCLANDTGYDQIFSGQVSVLAAPGDMLLALSGSGNSPNILRVLEMANGIGMHTWALVGFDGGEALKIASHAIHFPVHDMQIAEDLQMVVCHMVTKILSEPEA